MTYTEAIISGIVQGLTEFLPISSSGHLVILHHFFGYQEPKILFNIFLHIGTLFAVLVYFWRDIISLFAQKRRLLGLVILGSVPTALIGFIFKDSFEQHFSSIKIVGIMLFVTAVFLIVGEWVSKNKVGGKISWPKALLIGLIQGFAIMPGISRSGSTISTALMLKVDKKEAIRYSFLLSIPAVLGALLLKLKDGLAGASLSMPMLAGAIVSFLIGLFAIFLLIKAALGSKLKYFAIYCVILGGTIFLIA